MRKVTLEKDDKKSIFKKIPGFRSGKLWKKILASIFYFFMFLIILALITPSSTTTNESSASVCTPNWQCGNWSSCSMEEKQTRTCTDMNGCNKISNKPAETQNCELSASDIKNLTIDVTDKELLRHNENYIGKVVYFKGFVQEITQENNKYNFMTCGTSWCDYKVYWVNNYAGDKLLDGDFVKVWGKVTGIKTYETITILDQTNTHEVPEVDALIVECTTCGY
ncbi:MAG: hypothetical protein PHU12_00660 [Candidatus Aenigmarchaeota archaeon]|nr:hypothetical protein [Candidatus Aenigmarchaeota archaeon]